MARVDVWYQCRDCRARRKGAEGLLFCPDCGGEVSRIGYRSSPAGTTSTNTGRARARRRRF